MADWSRLRAALGVASESVRLTWAELDQLVGGLPLSAGKHRPWWSGDRSHVRAWQDAGYSIANLVMGEEVTFVRTNAPAPASAAVASPRSQEPETGVDLLLVTCVKEKLASPAQAQDLYVSDLFRKQRRYAEHLGVPWFILSAEHGLVGPTEWLAPYDRYLPDTTASYRRAWAAWVVARLELLTGPLSDRIVEIHAAESYIDPLRRPLTERGARILEPLRGLTIGHRLQWYGRSTAAITRRRDEQENDSGIDPEEFAERLLDAAAAVSPAEFLDTRGAGFGVPGLYSWWVDEAGAADLSAGLEAAIEPGLVYAGLAGATRWPSGKRSSNTLWKRIKRMHLGGRHQLSTFRWSLGSVLAAARGDDEIDEVALTEWMHAHLKVLAIPFPDADALGHVETGVLCTLDPPLNLDKVVPSPIRSRLTALRRRYSRKAKP